MKKLLLLTLTAALAFSCNRSTDKPDAYGWVEADEWTISAEGSGRILFFEAKEGEKLKRGEVLAVVDTALLTLERAQLKARINSVYAKTVNIPNRLIALKEDADATRKEITRFEALVASGAGTQKQVDDLKAKLAITEKNIESMRRSLSEQNQSMLSEIEPLEAQVRSLDKRLEQCTVRNTQNATLIQKLAFEGEFATPGKPLALVTNLDDIYVKCFVTQTQLSQIKLGQTVKVFFDVAGEKPKQMAATVARFEDKAEFTPKNIITKDERELMVFAIYLAIKNDGTLKSGMPVEVRF